MPDCRFTDLNAIMEAGQQVAVLWQEEESLAFVANGRAYRSEFHINPSAETMPGMPHSPRFPPGAFALITERKRRPGERDRFQWFCDACRALVHEVVFEVRDYTENPVSAAYREYYTAVEHRTCKACGHVMPAPADESFRETNPTVKAR